MERTFLVGETHLKQYIFIDFFEQAAREGKNINEYFQIFHFTVANGDCPARDDLLAACPVEMNE